MIEWYNTSPPCDIMTLSYDGIHNFPTMLTGHSYEWAHMPTGILIKLDLWKATFTEDMLIDQHPSEFYETFGFNIICDDVVGIFACFESEESYMMAILKYPKLFVNSCRTEL